MILTMLWYNFNIVVYNWKSQYQPGDDLFMFPVIVTHGNPRHASPIFKEVHGTVQYSNYIGLAVCFWSLWCFTGQRLKPCGGSVCFGCFSSKEIIIYFCSPAMKLKEYPYGSFNRLEWQPLCTSRRTAKWQTTICSTETSSFSRSRNGIPGRSIIWFICISPLPISEKENWAFWEDFVPQVLNQPWILNEKPFRVGGGIVKSPSRTGMIITGI